MASIKSKKSALSAKLPSSNKKRTIRAAPSIEESKKQLASGRLAGSISIIRCAIADLKKHFAKLAHPSYSVPGLPKLDTLASEGAVEELPLLIGSGYVALEKLTGKFHYIEEAKSWLEKADHSSPLYKWNLAIVMHKTGLHSGEPSDLIKALSLFLDSEKEANFPPNLYIDIGKCYLDLSKLTTSPTPLEKGIAFLKLAIEKQSVPEAWELLGDLISELYTYHLNPQMVTQASSCFCAATRLLQDSPVKASKTFLKWAKMLLKSSHIEYSSQNLKLAIEKCQLAKDCVGETAEILATWADALSLFASEEDDKHLLDFSIEKVEDAFKQAEKGVHASLALAYGNVHIARGHYFEDHTDFQKGLPYLKQALRKEKNNPYLYAALSKAVIDGSEYQESDSLALKTGKNYLEKAVAIAPKPTFLFPYALACGKYAISTESEEWVKYSLLQYQRAFESFCGQQFNLPPEWLSEYGLFLTHAGNILEKEELYEKSVEVYQSLLLIDPDYPDLHFNFAVSLAAFAGSSGTREDLIRAIHHFRLAHKFDEECGEILLEWGTCLMHLAEETEYEPEADHYFFESEQKLKAAAAQGNTAAFYQLGCLYSFLGKVEGAFRFLEKAREYHDLPDADYLLEDDYLENIRGYARFKALLSQSEL